MSLLRYIALDFIDRIVCDDGETDELPTVDEDYEALQSNQVGN